MRSRRDASGSAPRELPVFDERIQGGGCEPVVRTPMLCLRGVQGISDLFFRKLRPLHRASSRQMLGELDANLLSFYPVRLFRGNASGRVQPPYATTHPLRTSPITVFSLSPHPLISEYPHVFPTIRLSRAFCGSRRSTPCCNSCRLNHRDGHNGGPTDGGYAQSHEDLLRSHPERGKFRADQWTDVLVRGANRQRGTRTGRYSEDIRHTKVREIPCSRPRSQTSPPNSQAV